MAHHTLKTAYQQLTDRLNRFPQGAPPSKHLFAILKMLFSEREAELISSLPIKPFTADKASRIWKTNITETKNILDELAGRALLVDIEQNGLDFLPFLEHFGRMFDPGGPRHIGDVQ